ncbi:MAG: RluA family pseudouridine synthase [Gemmatimonadota bacterium]|nr:RluA family pseudouridine synthase [Gemmatimonadota bacterium]
MAEGERRHEFAVADDADARLDSYLAERLEVSRSRAAQWIEDGRVRVNGATPRKRDRPRQGDRIEVAVPAPTPSPMQAEPLPLDVVYQDADLLVVNKPPGLVVHPAPGHLSGTLVNALLHAVGDLSGIGGVLRPGIVHRLDRDTSGLLVVAKHDESHRRLADALRRREVRRVYLALAWGHLAADTLTVDAPIARHPTDRKRMAVVPGGRRAVTRFRRLERWRAADLLQAELETGRTHQIRVHLLHVGHPVVGDLTYGAGRERGFSGGERGWAAQLAGRTPRHFLHAARLSFQHPRSGEPMHFEAPLPPDLQTTVDWARAEDTRVA